MARIKQNTREAASVNFKHILRAKKLKATPRRVLLLKALHKTQRPLSVEALRLTLGGRMNEVTIYRALDALVREGLVVRIGISNIREHYEIVPLTRAHHHHHLVCSTCGDVEDVDVPEPTDFEKNILKQSKRFKKITSHSLEFFGLCRACITT